jgi:NADH:ubiquinone oxidoreductase subunit E
MKGTHTIFLCMGSACHQAGSYKLIPAISALVRQHHLEDRVQLKGAFCLDACMQGRSLKFGERVITGVTEEKLAALFASEILPKL